MKILSHRLEKFISKAMVADAMFPLWLLQREKEVAQVYVACLTAIGYYD